MAENIAAQKVLINKATSFGLTIHASLLAANLLCNMEYAEGEDWGREFRPCMQAVRKKYDYNHKHDQSSFDDMIAEFISTADCVRDLREAPEPKDGSAMEVNEMTDEQLRQLQSVLGEYGEYEESALAAADSDSSARESRKKKKKKKDKDKRRSASHGRS